MPTYQFENTETGEVFEDFMSISAREQFLKDNPHIQQIVSAPSLAYRMTKKPDSEFRDLLKNVKSKHRRSTVETW